MLHLMMETSKMLKKITNVEVPKSTIRKFVQGIRSVIKLDKRVKENSVIEPDGASF